MGTIFELDKSRKILRFYKRGKLLCGLNVLWANQGDKNSKYFHCCATKRFWKNTLEGIRDEEGVWRTTKEDVGEVMVNYYKSLFTSTKGIVSASMLECVLTMIDEEMNATLYKEFEVWEVISALQQMAPLKAPGCSFTNIFRAR